MYLWLLDCIFVARGSCIGFYIYLVSVVGFVFVSFGCMGPFWPHFCVVLREEILLLVLDLLSYNKD